MTATEIQTPPKLLTLALIRKHYVPLGSRTIFRKISEGRFPRADLRLGTKIRLWRRETVEQWIKEQVGEEVVK